MTFRPCLLTRSCRSPEGHPRPKDPLAVWRGRAGVEQRHPDECSLGLRCWRRPEMRLDLEAAQVEVRGLLDA